MTVINTNVGALMARTYSARANDKMTSSMQRLSSGLRINSAADDAAGLAVANKMQSQSLGINMAMRNSQDGISLVQTAEAGMNEITSLVLRMRELSVQMDNGVYTGTDRDNAQLEINALLAEIDKIAANTRFNDVALLNGTYDQTIRAGNTNAETIRISIDSLFAADTGAASSVWATLPYMRSLAPPVASEKDYTYDSSNFLSSRLGISASSYENLAATDSQAILSDVVSDAAFQRKDNMLMLKDEIAGLGYTYAMVKFTDQQWENVASNLSRSKALADELVELAGTNSMRASQIQSSLNQLEIQRSHYIGSLFHANDINAQGVFAENGLTNNKYADIINVYEDPETRQTISGEIAAIEVNFREMAKTLHDPRTCQHCLSQSSDIGSGGGGTASSSDEYAAATPLYTQSGSGATTVSSPSSDAVSPLVKGSAWSSVGDDSAPSTTNSLTYSFWDGTTSYNYDQGTRTEVSDHGSGNEAKLREIFELWDAVAPFSLDEVTESGDSNPVGDLRVAYTDYDPSSAQAFAYYPSGTAKGGDIYFETQNVDIAGDDFVEGNYNYLAAIHEVGHALGLSHPFDGGSKDGSTMNLNLDFQRNTVMTYVQSDRNTVISLSGSSASYSSIHSSTPGLLDIEAIEHIYGSTNWDFNSTDTTYGAGSGSDSFDDNYNYIRVIVDSGGTADALDASGVTNTGSIINLTPGTYSSIGYYETQAAKIAAVAGGNASAATWFEEQLTTLDALASASNSYYTSYSREALYRGQDNVGIAHNTWIENAIGGAGADTITGNSMSNIITGNGGNDTIDGGDGDDVAVFSGTQGAYTINNGSTLTVTGADGTDTLTNVEYLKFDDGAGTVTYYRVSDSTANISAATFGGYTLASSQTGAQTGGVTYGDGATNVGGLKLANIKVETQADAQNAVTVLNRSLEQISSGRAKLGAMMNRLTHNIDNQTKGEMMSKQARGRIVDTDMAIESTKLAQQMILSQAAQQAINMATQRQLTVLALLDT